MKIINYILDVLIICLYLMGIGDDETLDYDYLEESCLICVP